MPIIQYNCHFQEYSKKYSQSKWERWNNPRNT